MDWEEVNKALTTYDDGTWDYEAFQIKTFLEIMEELGWPPVYMIPPEQFRAYDGKALDSTTYGEAANYYPIITIRSDLEGKIRENTIYHEIAHHLWPWKPHWWIDIFGEKMAGGGGMGWYARHYKKTPDDLPPRQKLVKMARRQADKLKEIYKIKRTKKRK